jgi:hypothetical protein
LPKALKMSRLRLFQHTAGVGFDDHPDRLSAFQDQRFASARREMNRKLLTTVHYGDHSYVAAI